MAVQTDNQKMAEAAELIALVRSRHEDVYNLATLLSLAVKIEPALVRSMRLSLGPTFGTRPAMTVRTEALLCFSLLVESRGVDGFTLRPAVAHILRERLAGKPVFHQAWELLSRRHHGLPPIQVWQEQLTYISLGGRIPDLSVDDLVNEAASAVATGRRAGLQRTLTTMWTKVPQRAQSNVLLGELVNVASSSLIPATTSTSGDAIDSGAPDRGIRMDFSKIPRIAINVRFTADVVQIGYLVDGLGVCVELPAINPLTIETRIPERNEQWQSIRIPSFGFTEIKLDSATSIEIQAIDGRRYRCSSDDERVRSSSERIPASARFADALIADFSNMGLTEVPEQIFERSEIQEIKLGKNRLKQFDVRLLQMPNLIKLDLSENLIGSIGSMSNHRIEYLDLSNNRIQEIGHVFEFPRLRELWLQENAELDDIPDSITDMQQLKSWSFRGCRLAAIPASIRNLGTTKILEYLKNDRKVPETDLGADPDGKSTGEKQSNLFVHPLLRARDWQNRAELNEVCDWWRHGGRGVCSLIGMGGAGKTAIADRFLRMLPGALPADPDVPKDPTLPAPPSTFVFSFDDAQNPDAFFQSLQEWVQQSPTSGTPLSVSQLLLLFQQFPGLIVLDGLERVQEQRSRGMLGRLTSPKLREFLVRVANGFVSDLSILVLSRFSLVDLRDARPQFFRSIAVEQIDIKSAISLLRARGVSGTVQQLESIARQCDGHTLTVDLAGGYIAEYGHGDPGTSLEIEPDSNELSQRLKEEPNESRQVALQQEFRFAKLAERYREAMVRNTGTSVEGDQAALELLERICLFRFGVDAETLARTFTGKDAEKISGSALSSLSADQLQKKLDWLVRMHIVEQSEQSGPSLSSQLSPQQTYSVHPAVRVGFLSGINPDAALAGHEAIRQNLKISLGESPVENPSEPETLDLLEEIVHHTLDSGHIEEAWDIYLNRLGGYRNLGWRLGAFERGERILREFAGRRSPETLGEWLDEQIPFQSLPEKEQADFLNEWATYLREQGRLDAAAKSLDVGFELAARVKDGGLASYFNQNLGQIFQLTGRLTGESGKSALVAADEALRMAEQTEDERAKYDAHAVLAHTHVLLGQVNEAMSRFQMALELQISFLPEGPGTLINEAGNWNLKLLVRLGRHEQAARLIRENQSIQERLYSSSNQFSPISSVLLAEIVLIQGDVAEAQRLVESSRSWAESSDARELLCRVALALAQIELASISALTSANVEFAERVEGAKPSQSLSKYSVAISHVEEGLRIARDCGFGILHIELLLVRARIHLLQSDPAPALEDVQLALDDGIPANETTGQPELFAARNEACAYAWAVPIGLSLRAEALLLQVAQRFNQNSINPSAEHLPGDFIEVMVRARQLFEEALDLWRPLHDPEPEGPDQNFDVNGKEHNYRAHEPHARLQELEDGLLTHYPLGDRDA